MATLDELEGQCTGEGDRAQVGNALEVALRKLPAQAEVTGCLDRDRHRHRCGDESAEPAPEQQAGSDQQR
jgi:hypothetical protein